MMPLDLRWWLGALCALVLCTHSAWADPPKAKPKPPVQTDEYIKSEPFMTFEHSGYFRMRSDLFVNPQLGNDVGGLLKPLSGDKLSSSNLRLRWRPILKLGQKLRIGSVVDALDNVVMGSTPDWDAARADSGHVFWAQSQKGPTAQDVLRVRQLWGEWNFLHAVNIRVGRMGDHWGLGMVHNSGECLDCDFGDTTDRASLQFGVYGLQTLLFIDFPGEGATSATRFDAFGQPYDVGQVDDVVRWGFTLHSLPQGPKALEERRQDLGSGKAVVDWGIRNTFTSQDWSTDVQTAQPNSTCPSPTGNLLDTPYDCTVMHRRDASYWVPDAWIKLQWRPSYSTYFRMEFEAAALLGDVKFTQNVGSPSSAKDFLGFGGVLQLELVHNKLSYRLETGVASGDDVASGPFGPGFHEPTDTKYAENLAAQNNTEVTRFLFNRDYHVDLLLYREILGTVVNSVYVKPSVRAYLIKSHVQRFGAELSAIYGHALQTSSTPGGEASLGVEFDTRIFYEVPGKFIAAVDAGILVPLDALESQTGKSPETAYTVQARLTLTF